MVEQPLEEDLVKMTDASLSGNRQSNSGSELLRRRLLAGMAAIVVICGGLMGVSPTAAHADVTLDLPGKDCVWPTHAFLELYSAGTQYIKVTSHDGNSAFRNWPHSNTSRRNWVNSLKEDAKSGQVKTSDIINGVNWGCSVG